MPTSIERRVRRLEAPEAQAMMHFLEGRDGETSRECVLRHGLNPDAPRAFYFVSQGLFAEGYLNGGRHELGTPNFKS
jgi:hypothetical protein